jgi:hypothetical protein
MSMSPPETIATIGPLPLFRRYRCLPTVDSLSNKCSEYDLKTAENTVLRLCDRSRSGG